MVKPEQDQQKAAAIAAVENDPPGIRSVNEALEIHAGKLPEPDPNRKQSPGEVLFNRVVYTGIGFGVNEASSLWITDQFVHGKPKSWLGGKPFSKEGFEAASSWIAKRFKISNARAANGLLMATLLSGGTLLVLPMRWLEENKIGWVKKADHLIDSIKGNPLTAEEVKARDDEVEKAIACSPQQTWTALLVGRVAAMGASFITGNFIVGKSGNDKVMDFSEKHITAAAKAVGYKNADKNDTFKRYARLTGIETYSCAISSVVLEIASKLFARHGTEVHDPKICHDYAKKEAPPATAAPVSTEDDCDCRDKKSLIAEKFRAKKPASMPAAYAEKVKADKENPATLAV